MPPHRFHAPARRRDDHGLMRSLLFVPGDDARKLARALACGADAVILDLEDSVAPGAKALARERVAAFLREAREAQTRTRLYVRVNPLAGGLVDADLDAVMPQAPHGIVLPKSLNGASVQQLGVKLAVREARHELPDGATRVLPIATESARAMFGLGSYAGCSARLEGLSWGAEDLSADLGALAARLPDGGYAPPYQVARAMALFAAVAAGVTPIDTVFPAFRDLAGLRADAAAARRDGFEAKLAIHPDQVAVINEVFTPSAPELARAQAIVDAFAEAPQAGVVALEGQMLDAPHLARARKVLARAAGAG